jgi:hypothetical protein
MERVTTSHPFFRRGFALGGLVDVVVLVGRSCGWGPALVIATLAFACALALGLHLVLTARHRPREVSLFLGYAVGAAAIAAILGVVRMLAQTQAEPLDQTVQALWS